MCGNFSIRTATSSFRDKKVILRKLLNTSKESLNIRVKIISPLFQQGKTLWKKKVAKWNLKSIKIMISIYLRESQNSSLNSNHPKRRTLIFIKSILLTNNKMTLNTTVISQMMMKFQSMIVFLRNSMQMEHWRSRVSLS